MPNIKKIPVQSINIYINTVVQIIYRKYTQYTEDTVVYNSIVLIQYPICTQVQFYTVHRVYNQSNQAIFADHFKQSSNSHKGLWLWHEENIITKVKVPNFISFPKIFSNLL